MHTLRLLMTAASTTQHLFGSTLLSHVSSCISESGASRAAHATSESSSRSGRAIRGGSNIVHQLCEPSAGRDVVLHRFIERVVAEGIG